MIVDLFWTRSCTSENLPLLFRKISISMAAFSLWLSLLSSWSMLSTGCAFLLLFLVGKVISSFTFLRSRWKDPFPALSHVICARSTWITISWSVSCVDGKNQNRMYLMLLLWNVLRIFVSFGPVTRCYSVRSLANCLETEFELSFAL